MSIPATRRALTILGPGEVAVQERPLSPTLRPDYMLVKTAAIALNPADWKLLTRRPNKGTILGLDYAGTVVAISANPTHDFAVGDRVAGMVYGNYVFNAEDGASADYVYAKTGIACRVPPAMTWEEAATLGVGVTTVGQGLYQSFGLPWPGKAEMGEVLGGRRSVLVYGASTATGTLAVQMAKLSGLEVIATCSPHNFDMVRSLGADAVFDYKSPSCGADINAFTSNSLLYAFDCISEGTSLAICAAALSTSSPGGNGITPKYGVLLPVPEDKFPRDDVKPVLTLGYSAFGEKYRFRGADFEEKGDYVWIERWWTHVQELLERGLIKAHPPDVREGGLEGVVAGLKDLEDGKVSGVKLVYML
ncbi:GroES-like protein [Pseudovirgaria hyperparasitica]|uniref:GroES-like protein n=1 Tax=Pseudovirgaria hyperparasitica TaxID=470096 RepID=A0A6A6W2Z5_9PEZI|nr:GroES-like protein [Pseudovirgaria hyperparasitica]KAF2756499.1 GroES-like protein [Pseudovirgaria hyperparasitica]